ncbi:hypothetical protein Agabi119p4_2835 [Agaricus bisporus var. burnettii]|uniref:Fanconi-associated nuclease n=1 Tax=Agaricus bisporus var. burnettii TaxID=192524 RepID=A0A8H7KIC1_AGABI|nr:hypothetical protein Agabi119p4_2835 [Agaricus bisporus var. burnettii]
MPRSVQEQDIWLALFGKPGGNEQFEQQVESYDQESLEDRREGKKFKGASLYVKVFEDMVNAVMEQETHLLSDEEWDVLKVYRGLDYCTRYLLVRLAFRQPDWHALYSLDKYASEIGQEGLEQALKTLCIPIKDLACQPTPPPSPTLVIKKQEKVKEEDAALSLSFANREETPKPTIPPRLIQISKPSTKISDSEIEEPVVDPLNLKFDYFFRDQSSMTVREALNRLGLPDLREISKSMKVGSYTMRKEALINAMIDHAIGQHTLPSLAKGKGKKKQTSKNDGMIQSQLSFGQKPKTVSQLKRLREMAMERLGPCVKINPNISWLIGRLHIISYRGTEKPTKYCLPALLAGFKKWKFPDYEYERTGTIWPTREDLLEYEEALYLEVEMENLPEEASRSTSLVPENQGSNGKVAGNSIVKTERDKSVSLIRQVTEDPEVTASLNIRRARHMKNLYRAKIEPKWRVLLVRKEQEKGKAVERSPGLERFEAGHVYTRMMNKARKAFALLHEWHTELGILDELLKQVHWLKGKQAVWYERRALILGKHVEPCDFENARKGIIQALADEHTGIILRPSLFRRLERIQKKLNLLPEERVVCDTVLKDPLITSIKGKRSVEQIGIRLDQNLRPTKENAPVLLTDFFSNSLAVEGEEDVQEGAKDVKTTIIPIVDPASMQKRTGKSLWVGLNNEVVNVETYALQHYEMTGYVGFHAETRILTTIFALIFWDIIFSRVPGAFETKFQACPLDMFEDSFYRARTKLFQHRLEEIKNGKAKEYLKRYDDRFRPERIWCIGLSWDAFEQKQLLEIVECLGAKTLATICRLFCEDYAGRSSGVPDLIVWNMKEGICKFVEVKGPGDSPRPNQKLWFDALLRAGAHVEICRVIDQDAPEPLKRKRKTPISKPRKGCKAKEEDEEDGVLQHQQNSDDDGDYLPSPTSKRRKLDCGLSPGGMKIEQATPTSALGNPYPCTPSSKLRARSVPISIETISPCPSVKR